jgi:4-hydroxybenzoate polyprenyltransferase
VVRAVVDWWDAVELWLTQLAFPFQVALAIAVGLPLCWLAAAGIDRLVDVAIERTTERTTERASAGRSRTGPPRAP